MRNNRLAVFNLFLLISLLSCAFPSVANYSIPKIYSTSYVAEWNYLVYMGADNNLERFAIDNIAEMKEVGSSKNVNILVLFDRSPGYDKSHLNWSGTKLFRITRGDNSFNDDLIRDYGELDMTDPVNLENILFNTQENYPSKKTALVLWSHGTGVYPDGVIEQSTTAQPLSVVQDYSTGYGANVSMAMQDIETVIARYNNQTGKKLDVLQFDSCLMQMNEIIWQLADEINYIAGSQPDIPGTGSDYKSILNFLVNNPSMNAESLALFLVESFWNRYKDSIVSTSYSAISTEFFPIYKSKFTSWAQTINDLSISDLFIIKSLRENLPQYQKSQPEYIDLYSFLKTIVDEPAFYNSKLNEATRNLLEDFGEIVMSCKSINIFHGNLYGLGANFPNTTQLLKYYTAPSELPLPAIYRETQWDEVIQKIAGL